MYASSILHRLGKTQSVNFIGSIRYLSTKGPLVHRLVQLTEFIVSVTLQKWEMPSCSIAINSICEIRKYY